MYTFVVHTKKVIIDVQKKVKKAARQHKFTFNEEKSVLSPTKFQRLGLLVENSNIKPHPKHL